jgi:hypothetical protein
MSVSSLIFFFAMETSWKHHENFLLTAVIARLSQNELHKCFPLDDGPRNALDREVRQAVGERGQAAKVEV